MVEKIFTILILCIMFAQICIVSVKHGKPKEGTHNVWVTIFAEIISFIIYYFAGLFDKLF